MSSVSTLWGVIVSSKGLPTSHYGRAATDGRAAAVFWPGLSQAAERDVVCLFLA